MTFPLRPPAVVQPIRRLRPLYRRGDFVVPVKGYPILYEVVCKETDNQVRVRGANWPAGYTIVVRQQEVHSVSRILSPSLAVVSSPAAGVVPPSRLVGPVGRAKWPATVVPRAARAH